MDYLPPVVAVPLTQNAAELTASAAVKAMTTVKRTLLLKEMLLPNKKFKFS